jgi:prepilin-type processing-associated H-X9-DG protein
MVLACIAVLAMIIIPVVSGVRTAAHRTASASNLRHWGTAMLTYQADNRGHLPVEGGYQGKMSGVNDADDYAWWHQVGHEVNAKAWFNVLPPYASEAALRDLLPGASNEERRVHIINFRNSLFFAPGTQMRDSATTGALSGNKVPMGYFINSQIYNTDGATTAGTSSGVLRVQGLRYNMVPRPGRTAFMAEARVANDEIVPDFDEGRAADVFRARGQSRHVASRYGGRTSIVFFDGSVRTEQSRAVKTDGSRALGIIWNPWTD